jgi:hypothetical protein
MPFRNKPENLLLQTSFEGFDDTRNESVYMISV